MIPLLLLKVLPIPTPILLQKVLAILLHQYFSDTFNVVSCHRGAYIYK